MGLVNLHRRTIFLMIEAAGKLNSRGTYFLWNTRVWEFGDSVFSWDSNATFSAAEVTYQNARR